MNWLSFFLLEDPNVRLVVLGTVVLAALTALAGCFTFLRKRSLAGDAASHAVLPGICLAFIIEPSKTGWLLPLGAFASAWLGLLAIDWLSNRTRLKPDSAIAVVLSSTFALGIFLLTGIQQSGQAAQSGLDKYLFGRAASLLPEDLYAFFVVGGLLLVLTLVFYKELVLLCFDAAFAHNSGKNIRWLEVLLSTLIVLAIVIGIQTIGVVLMAAMLITPAAAARYFTSHLKHMLWLAAAMSAGSALAGALISYAHTGMPTGPFTVLVLSIMALGAFFFAPKKGVVANLLRQRDYKRKIARENLLKAAWHLGEQTNDFFQPFRASDILDVRSFHSGTLDQTLKLLVRGQYLKRAGQDRFIFTPKGRDEGQRMARLHRLWELYLSQKLNISSDHVHDDAEAIEHLLTPEDEALLTRLLHKPATDPHGEQIPYADQ